MNLTPSQINELLSIIDTHIELLDDRLAYFQGDINGEYFNGMVADRTRAHLLRNAVKSSGDTFTIAVKIPDRGVDRN